jgi:uncharacterized protein involved in exopolysaccharide biosynthesis
MPARFEAEREFDLKNVWARLRARWWLLVFGVVAGAMVGVLVAASKGQTWEAKTLLYLGQPFTSSGGGQIQSLATNPATVSEIVRSEFSLRRAAAVSGLPVGELRSHVTAAPVGVGSTSSSQSKTAAPSPLVLVTVQGQNKRRVQRAADSLARSVISSVSSYVDQKTSLLNAQIESAQAELETIDGEVASYNKQLRALQTDKSLSPTDKLIAVSTLNSSVGYAEQRRGTVQQELYQNQQLLSLALNVERSRIVGAAAAARVTATSRRNAAIVGALIGLLLGATAAYLAAPLAARR